MSQDPEIMRRLAFIRLLLSRADDASRQHAPYSFDSINRYHDAAEMFLALAAQEHSLGIPREFLGYWDLLASHLGRPLAHKGGMTKFNKVRVNLKHYGAEPAPSEISHARTLVRSLIEDECTALFGCELQDASLTAFVACQEARDLLAHAEEGWERGDAPVEAMADLAEAFEFMIKDYEGRKKLSWQTSVFDSTADMTFLGPFSRGVEGNQKRFEEAVIKSLQALDFHVMLAGLGIDFRRYGKFRALTPHVLHMIAGNRVVHERRGAAAPSQEDFDFCRDFAVATAIHLAELDYHVDLEAAWREAARAEAAQAEAITPDSAE